MRYHQILVALEGAGVPYVVVGGMAAALHGQPHEPRDLDLVIDSAAGDQITRILMDHGFFPTIPLALHVLTVLRFVSSDACEVDVFARFAVPFAELFANAEMLDYDGVSVRAASLADLARAKERTGR